MAIVKIKFAKHLVNLVRYVMDGRSPNDPLVTNDCDERNVAGDFGALQQFHNGNGTVNVIHIVQSWKESESNALLPDEFNAIGRELVEKKFPGHAFAVVTHTDTSKVHNHILVSPWHSQTGTKVENKKRHLYELREISDDICKSRGLSVIDRTGKERYARLPEKVQKVAKFRGHSWILDLCQKADFARAFATSFDEYVGILGELGVKARVEEKNITYFYSEKVRGKRGSKIGKSYDKSGLQKAFQSNDEKFSRVPGLREQVRGLVDDAIVGKTNQSQSRTKLERLSESTYRSFVRDYSAYTKSDRPGRANRYPHQLDLASSIIPIDELRRARTSNIIQYCRANKIGLERNSDGKFVLKGRSFVEISEYEWMNKRNRTKGSLIELVAAHKNMTFLQAVADITGNKRLQILEHHLGEIKRKYTSFYIPNEHRLNELDAKVKIASVLLQHGCDHSHATTLFKTGQAQVGQGGGVRIFGKDDAGGCFEFNETDTHVWKMSRAGNVSKAFFAVSNASKKMSLYLDPFAFLTTHGKHALWTAKHPHDVLCMMEPNAKIFDQHLAANRHIRQVEVFLDPKSQNHEAELDFFNNLKSRSPKLGIQIIESRGLDRDRSRGDHLPSL